jgi:hypothetical protein
LARHSRMASSFCATRRALNASTIGGAFALVLFMPYT